MSPFIPILLLFLGWSSNCYQNNKESLMIPYANRPVHIDGKLKEWNGRALKSFEINRFGEPFSNKIQVSLSWNQDYLYGYFRVFDKQLVGLEPAEAQKRLQYNDGVEIYLDSGNDSGDTLDINDYQFIIDIFGHTAIFRGDRLDKYLKHVVPKEAGIANIVFKSAASHIGTANQMNDADSLYQVEFGIPWASIGVQPEKGIVLKMDLCVNDNDTLVDFNLLPPGPVHLYTYKSLTGSEDFGFPRDWFPIQLNGEPNLLMRLTLLFQMEWIFILLAVSLVFLLLIIWYRIRIHQLKQIPIRAELTDTQLLKTLTVTPAKKIKTESPLICRAKQIILNKLDQPVKPEQLASELATSLRNLERVFQKELETTPNTFIVLVKLEYASDLLKKGNVPISEIADKVGFSDPAYFSRVFKKYFNQTPREFVSGSVR